MHLYCRIESTCDKTSCGSQFKCGIEYMKFIYFYCGEVCYCIKLSGGILVNNKSYFSLLFAFFRCPHFYTQLKHCWTYRCHIYNTFLKLIQRSVPLFYRSFERTTPILFEKLITKSVHNAFMREKRELFDKASTSCLPSVIRMGRDLREEDLQQHVSFFREKLVGLPSRLPSIYSCYRYFAKEVSEMWFVDQGHFVLISALKLSPVSQLLPHCNEIG